MRGNELLDKMDLIDPVYIEEADTKPKMKKSLWIKGSAIAACLCLAAGALMMPGIWTKPESPNSEPGTTDSIDQPSATNPQLNIGGMGFEGYMYYDISELNSGNPWKEDMNLGSLPVYKNGAYDPSGAGVPKGLSEAEMMEKLNSFVSSLHLTIVSTELIADGFIKQDGKLIPDPNPTKIEAVTDHGTIRVEADGCIHYFLPEGGLPLPDGYHFTRSNTTNDEAQEVLSYLLDIYGQLLKLEKPIAAPSGQYTIDGQFHRSYTIYDAGSNLESILNYNFRRITFTPSESGNLSAIHLDDGLFSAEKIGDYPIVTVDEATERFISGNYQTSVPVAFPGEDFIEKVELVYRTGRLEEMLLPYYRFYVLLPDHVVTDTGLKTCGIYYVPAIADAYVEDLHITHR